MTGRPEFTGQKLAALSRLRDELHTPAAISKLRAAADAIRALTSRRSDAELRSKIEAAVQAAGDASLAAVFREEWGNA